MLKITPEQNWHPGNSNWNSIGNSIGNPDPICFLWIAQMHAASSPDHAWSPGRKGRMSFAQLSRSLVIWKYPGYFHKMHQKDFSSATSCCENRRTMTESYIFARYTCIHEISAHGKNLWASNHIYSIYMLKTMTWFSPRQVSQALKSVTLLCRLASDARKVGPTLGCVILIPRCSGSIQGDSKIENTQKFLLVRVQDATGLKSSWNGHIWSKDVQGLPLQILSVRRVWIYGWLPLPLLQVDDLDQGCRAQQTEKLTLWIVRPSRLQ